MGGLRSRSLLSPAAFALATLALIVSMFVAERSMRADALRRAGAELEAVAALKVGTLEAWRHEQLRTARYAASYPSVANLARGSPPSVDPALREHVRQVFANLADRYDYGFVGAFREDGLPLVTWPEGLATQVEPALLRAAATQHGVTRLALAADDRPFLDVAVPVEGQSAAPIVIALRVDARPMLHELLRGWARPSRSGGAALITRDGERVRLLEVPEVSTVLGVVTHPVSARGLAAVRIALGETGVLDGVDHAGERLRIAAVAVPSSDWKLATQMSVADVLAPLEGPRFMNRLLVGALALAGAALLWRWWRGELREVEMEARFRQLAESIREVFWLAAVPDERVLYVSPAYETIWGRTRQRLYESPSDWQDAIHPDDRRSVHEAWATRRTLGTYDEEYRIVRPDGSVRWIRDRAFPVQGEGGRVVRIAGVAEDITQRKEAELARQRLAAAVEQTPASIVITDASGVILYVNPAFEQTTGYAAAEVLGGKPSLLKSGKHDEGFYRDLWARISAGQTWSGRLVNRTKGGALFTEDAVIAPVRDGSGQIRSYVAVKRDVTRELDMQQRLADSQRLEGIARLAGGIAHDFNNLLTVILSCSEALSADLAAGRPPTAADADEIRAAGERARDLTRKLLAFARREVIEPVPLDLGAVMRDLEKLLRRLLNEDIALDVRTQPDLWRVRCDPGQLEQLVLNLVVNARDAMPEGGRLAIETSNLEVREEDLHAHPGIAPGQHVVMRVQDSGVGMAPEVRAHAFEPFFTTKPTGEGTGLGLATAYGIVRQNGGVIRVESEPGEGTTFVVAFPRCLDPIAVPRELPAPAERGGSETILLVEDEPSVRSVAARALRAGGYEVLEASNGFEAVELMAREMDRVRLLVTDVVMPGIDGRQLAQTMRTSWPGIRVLYVSGHAHDVLAQRGVLERGVDLLPKPFSATALLDRVRAILDA